MRRRYRGLGYLFFLLIVITATIMAVSFYQRLANPDTRPAETLVPKAMEDTVRLKADHAYILEALPNDYKASHENFHYYPGIKMVAQEKRSACLLCHTILPHNKNIRNRAFLNLHSGYVACTTCHLADSTDVSFVWLDTETGKQVVGVERPETRWKDVGKYQLVPVRKGSIIFTPQDDPAVAAKVAGGALEDEAMNKALREELEAGIMKTGRACKRCHTQDGYIDFRGAGYSEERSAELESLSTPSVFESYENFYMPTK